MRFVAKFVPNTFLTTSLHETEFSKIFGYPGYSLHPKYGECSEYFKYPYTVKSLTSYRNESVLDFNLNQKQHYVQTEENTNTKKWLEDSKSNWKTSVCCSLQRNHELSGQNWYENQLYRMRTKNCQLVQTIFLSSARFISIEHIYTIQSEALKKLSNLVIFEVNWFSNWFEYMISTNIQLAIRLPKIILYILLQVIFYL